MKSVFWNSIGSHRSFPFVARTFIGRSKSRISPDTKLLITFCNPNPIPTLNAPARIVTFVKSIPSAPKATKKPMSRMT